MLHFLLGWLYKIFFKEQVNGLKVAISGLLDHVNDARDFKYSALGGGSGYVPRFTKFELPIVSIKNQTPNNTCVFQSYAVCREHEEGVALSARSLVAYANKKGYIKGNGLSSIRLGQQAGREFGIAQESLAPEENTRWEDYKNLPLSMAVANDAAKHKPKNTFWVKTKDEWLKALDDGHSIHTGFDWYSSYNMTGGLKSPWILPWRKGYKVGGHAVRCMGYDIPGQLFIFQNSFGPDWGDGGKFYVRMSDILKEGITGAVSVSLERNQLQAFLASHEGQNIKSYQSPIIYRVENGKKRPFPDEATYFAHGGILNGDGTGNYQDVAQSVVSLIPDGEPMTV